MRFRIGPFVAEFGASEQRNVVDTRNSGGRESSVRLALLAESFDSALSFYVLVSEFMMSGADSSAIELQAWNVRRLSARLGFEEMNVRPEIFLPNAVVYSNLPRELVGKLLNHVWLACNIRILGLRGRSTSFREILPNLNQDSLPEGVDFVIEKKSVGVSDFLCVRCDELRSASLIEFLRISAFHLKYPLLEARLPF
jgi:hypothetical protein